MLQFIFFRLSFGSLLKVLKNVLRSLFDIYIAITKYLQKCAIKVG